MGNDFCLSRIGECAAATSAAVHDCAGGAALPRLNNVGGVSKPDTSSDKPALLHFGADYLVLNVVSLIDHATSQSIVQLSQIFDKENGEVSWGNSVTKFKKTSSKEAKDKESGIRRVYLALGRHNILAIEEIGESSQLKIALRYRYDYRISFYGSFFASVRLGLLSLGDFFDAFLDDIAAGSIIHSVSRLDICADIRSVSTIEVRDGVDILCEDKAKEFHYRGSDKAVSKAGTIYYGDSGDRDWHARIYDKKDEICHEDKKRNKPSKEDLFPDYFDFDSPVTRVEIELKSACRSSEIDLSKALNLEVQLGLFLKHLDNKYVKWKIAGFVRTEMALRGFDAWKVKNRKLTRRRISNMPAIKQLRDRGMNLAKRLGVSYDKLNTICEELWYKQPPDDVKYAGLKLNSDVFSFDLFPDDQDA